MKKTKKSTLKLVKKLNNMRKIKPGKDYIGVGGGVLILNNQNETLLLKRGKKSKNEVGFWNKPGGAVDYGEKIIDAMRREVKEEIGVDVKIFGYLLHSDHIIKKDKQHWVGFNLLGRIKSGTPKIMETQKHEEMLWFNLDKLPKKLSPPTKEAIKNYLQGKYIKL
jgi:8-oxo-dGTP diphosphatase